ncbi:hypothetical protein Tco_1121463 [Tanacetum coccineum]|uniref:Uncharacterized protein n=1 Tax=Tanacetum coccineum TaxID=301880 RepID=A0ABQ5IXS4_9ASTR
MLPYLEIDFDIKFPRALQCSGLDDVASRQGDIAVRGSLVYRQADGEIEHEETVSILKTLDVEVLANWVFDLNIVDCGKGNDLEVG